MSINDLMKLLEEGTGLPVAYFQFIETDDTPLPSLPNICVVALDSNNFFADDTVYLESENVDIELYTKDKSPSTEAIVKNVLKENNLPFQKNEVWIESQKVFQITYEVELKL
ncbi:hypothetical protein [Niallia sp. RD1]|uniref:hypothetical protein n=1 Tax=Niallia sp. RD1 TaxID=2962858 RepID=UPI0020C1A1E7|nr:hypothetical protein [Niallia sp. RD1]UTI42103.1 hypothetical protein NKG37_25375 [Niallia sp. RD1]